LCDKKWHFRTIQFVLFALEIKDVENSVENYENFSKSVWKQLDIRMLITFFLKFFIKHITSLSENNRKNSTNSNISQINIFFEIKTNLFYYTK